MIESGPKKAQYHEETPSLNSRMNISEDAFLSSILIETSLKENLKFIQEISDILGNASRLEKIEKDRFCTQQRLFMKQYMTILLKKINPEDH